MGMSGVRNSCSVLLFYAPPQRQLKRQAINLNMGRDVAGHEDRDAAAAQGRRKSSQELANLISWNNIPTREGVPTT